jgi:hypothetical protein
MGRDAMEMWNREASPYSVAHSCSLKSGCWCTIFCYPYDHIDSSINSNFSCSLHEWNRYARTSLEHLDSLQCVRMSDLTGWEGKLMCMQCKLALFVVFTVLVSALKIIEEIIVNLCHVKTWKGAE